MLHVTIVTIPLTIGDYVTIDHTVVLHGCTIEDCFPNGMGAIMLDNVHDHQHSIIAAVSMVLEGFGVPDGKHIAGVHTKIKRSLIDREIQMLQLSTRNYISVRTHLSIMNNQRGNI